MFLEIEDFSLEDLKKDYENKDFMKKYRTNKYGENYMDEKYEYICTNKEIKSNEDDDDLGYVDFSKEKDYIYYLKYEFIKLCNTNNNEESITISTFEKGKKLTHTDIKDSSRNMELHIFEDIINYMNINKDFKYVYYVKDMCRCGKNQIVVTNNGFKLPEICRNKSIFRVVMKVDKEEMLKILESET